jgi:DNA-binding response OmpR family regulator
METLKVLIADDSERLLAALRIQLQAQGMAVTTCSDAYMALDQARKCRPDVMVLDICMPAGNGFSVLERMEKIPEIRGVPVIYITGDRSAALDIKARRMGACGLIHKPISLSALVTLIKRATGTQIVGPDVDSGNAGAMEFDVSIARDVNDIPGVKQ